MLQCFIYLVLLHAYMCFSLWGKSQGGCFWNHFRPPQKGSGEHGFQKVLLLSWSFSGERPPKLLRQQSSIHRKFCRLPSSKTSGEISPFNCLTLMVTTKCHLPVMKVSIFATPDACAGIDGDDDEDEGASNIFPLDANAMHCHIKQSPGGCFIFFWPCFSYCTGHIVPSLSKETGTANASCAKDVSCLISRIQYHPISTFWYPSFFFVLGSCVHFKYHTEILLGPGFF